jgi:RecA-family ATPase
MKDDINDTLRTKGEDAARARHDQARKYQPSPKSPRPRTIAPRRPAPLSWIDMSNWDNEPIPKQEWAVLNRIPLRQCVLFSGEGAAGKSTVELHRSAAHVLGRDWLGTMPEKGPAILIDAEDGADVLHRRLADIIRHYGVTFDDLIKGGLHIMSLAGMDAVLATAARNGKVEPTALYKQLFEAAGAIKPKSISIASCANIFSGDENNRSQVQQLVGLLTRMAIVANGSLVLVSHPSLTGINTDSGLAGSTQWHNAVRARFYMKGVKPGSDEEQPNNDLREIAFKKNQYGQKSESLVLRYNDGMFLPIPGVSTLDKAAAEQKAEQVFFRLLVRFTSENRKVSHNLKANNAAPTMFAVEQEAKQVGIGKDTLADAMRRLLTNGKIKNIGYGPPSRGWEKLVISASGRPEMDCTAPCTAP